MKFRRFSHELQHISYFFEKPVHFSADLTINPYIHATNTYQKNISRKSQSLIYFQSVMRLSPHFGEMFCRFLTKRYILERNGYRGPTFTTPQTTQKYFEPNLRDLLSKSILEHKGYTLRFWPKISSFRIPRFSGILFVRPYCYENWL